MLDSITGDAVDGCFWQAITNAPPEVNRRWNKACNETHVRDHVRGTEQFLRHAWRNTKYRDVCLQGYRVTDKVMSADNNTVVDLLSPPFQSSP